MRFKECAVYLINMLEPMESLGGIMKDSEFKRIAHPVGNLVIASRGTTVSQGYKPDITVEDKNGESTRLS